MGFPGGSDSKESTRSAEDLSLIPGLGRSHGRGHGNPLQYSCLDNPHGQRSLVGCIPWGHKELDTTERLSSTQHKPQPIQFFQQRTNSTLSKSCASLLVQNLEGNSECLKIPQHSSWKERSIKMHFVQNINSLVCEDRTYRVCRQSLPCDPLTS